MKIIGSIADEPKEDIPFSIDMWYNRSQKSWVIQVKDKECNQIGDAVYVYSKPEALNQVDYWKEKYGIPLIRT